MAHERVGHIRFPVFQAPKDRNPPLSGGMALPDERITEFIAYAEWIRKDCQIGALTGSNTPDQRTQALGAYHTVLQLEAKFRELFLTPFQAPAIADEPKENNG